MHYARTNTLCNVFGAIQKYVGRPVLAIKYDNLKDYNACQKRPSCELSEIIFVKNVTIDIKKEKEKKSFTVLSSNSFQVKISIQVFYFRRKVLVSIDHVTQFLNFFLIHSYHALKLTFQTITSNTVFEFKSSFFFSTAFTKQFFSFFFSFACICMDRKFRIFQTAVTIK